jgi:transglutaminase-like putative cysteine protease
MSQVARSRLFITLLVAGFVTCTVYFYHSHDVTAQASWQPQSLEISYAGKIQLDASGANQVQVWIPLASDREGQHIKQRNIDIPFEYQITKESRYGNEILHAELTAPYPESIEFAINYVAEVSEENFLNQNKESQVDQYLTPSRLMIVDEEVQSRSREATRGKASLIEKARAIYDDVIRSVSYDKITPGWGRGDTKRVCLLGKGNCTDFHSLFISMSQAANIPARFKIGLPIPDQKEGAITGYHCWAEYYHSVKGWQPIDASEAWKHPELREAYFSRFSTNKFLLSVGRDITLVPQQSGNPVNIFFYPYVEVDGAPVETNFASDFSFKKVALT